MIRRTIWPGLILACAVILPATGSGALDGPAPAAPPASGQEQPTSLLLITVDTTRADHLGCYGYKNAATPNIDSLAEGGTLFTNALSPTPLTLPSHATIMTGLTPRSHGVRDNSTFRLGRGVPVLAGALTAHGYDTAAFVSSVVLDRLLGLDRGFRIYDDSVRVGDRSAFNYQERAASQTGEAVIDALDELEAPFFLWVHYFDPHLPYVPPEPFAGNFRDRPYDGEIAFMDREIGSLLASIRRKGVPLLTVVAGDHGESLGDHGEDAHGIFIYQSTQHVPLIITGPGIPAGKKVASRTGLIDIAPTVLDLLGLPAMDGVEGRSLLPVMHGERLDDTVYELETFFPMLAYGWAPLRAVVRGDLKYIDAPAPELYHLGNDPGETRNLLNSHPDRGTALARELGTRTAGDALSPAEHDPELAEQKRLLESIGYISGTISPGGGDPIDPKDGVSWIADLEAGRRAVQHGFPNEGIAPLERLLRRNPENVPAILVLAQCNLGSGDPVKAAALARRALEIHPGDPLVHFNLANALAAEAAIRPDAAGEADHHYSRSIALNPRYAEAYLNFSSFLSKRSLHQKALDLLIRARREGVRDPDIEVALAVLELRRGEAPSAKAAFLRALELNPRAAGALEAMARLTFHEGEFDAAVGFYRRLLDVSPSAATARTLGSVLLFKLDDTDGAREAFRRALALSGPDDSERVVLLELLRELGDLQEE